MYYALPLPLSAPSLMARMAGFGLLRVPEGLGLDSATVKKIMLCKYAQHALIKPAFLFRQDIDPNNLRGGVSALEFINQVNEQVRPQSEDDILITYASRHLSAFNGMLIQNFFLPDAMSRFNYVVDLKTALETCYYFGNVKVKNSKSLNQAAKELGFTGDLTNQMQRIDALFYIYNHLLSHDLKIMSFLHGNRAVRFAEHAPGKFLVHVNESGKLCLLKVLNQSDDHRLLKVLMSDGRSVKVQCINVDLAPLLAPCGILTPQRQSDLGFNLANEQDRLNNVSFVDLLDADESDAAIVKAAPAYSGQSSDEAELNAYAHAAAILEKDLPFYDAYFYKLSLPERNVFERMSSHDIRQETNITHIADPKSKFGQQVLCYLVENFPKAVFDGQIEQYRDYVSHTVAKRASSIKNDLSLLVSSIDHDDKKAVELLNRIASFFQLAAKK